jgi:hypothetical protein
VRARALGEERREQREEAVGALPGSSRPTVRITASSAPRPSPARISPTAPGGSGRTRPGSTMFGITVTSRAGTPSVPTSIERAASDTAMCASVTRRTIG